MKKLNALKNKLRKFFGAIWICRPRLIIDLSQRVGNHKLNGEGALFSYCKEEISRRYILERSGKEMKFLDVGARNGRLEYLLGIEKNLKFNTDFYRQNRKIFDERYSYSGLDLLPENNLEVIVGDICDSEFLEFHIGAIDAFDVVYSNNVFEHLHDPFTAAKNLWRMCKPGGLLVTIVPFSQRFHASPDDYFRFTHRGVEEIFQRAGSVIVHESGYDIVGRRNNWQGSGLYFDLVPADRFGAWRETWFTVCVLEKR